MEFRSYYFEDKSAESMAMVVHKAGYKVGRRVVHMTVSMALVYRAELDMAADAVGVSPLLTARQWDS